MSTRRNSAANCRSLADYIEQFRQRGVEVFYVEQQGYRRVTWSYGDVARTSAQFARELETRGIAPGQRVLLEGRNSAEWVSAFLGCILRGAIAVPIDRIATADFTQRVADRVEAKFIVASRERVLEPLTISRLDLEEFRQSISGHSTEPYATPPLDHDSIAEIIFTSGATAEPKGVVISHGNILANLEPLEGAMQPYLKWERLVHPLRFLDAVPLSHVFGQFLGVWIPPLLDATVVFQDSQNPAELVRTIHEERVSVLIAVPRALQALHNKIERDLEAAGHLDAFRRDFAAAENEHFLRRMWRFRRIHRQLGWKFWAVISGGATLDAETERFWMRTGFAAIQGYGLTETTSLVSVNHPFRLGRGSIGKVLEGREVKLDPGGEILVRGKNIAAGYWQRGEVHSFQRAAPEQGGGDQESEWFHTGDLGALDDQGNLYFKGRKKSVIVTSAGMKVYPEDLEAALRREPEVRDCAVIGLERDGNTEPCAVLLLRHASVEANSNGAAKIVEHANTQLAEYQRIREWYVWPAADFPRTSTGKPKIAEIRATTEAALFPAAPEQSAKAGSTGASGGVAELLARVRGPRGGVSVPANAGLESELNLSSLDRVELLSAVEDRYQVHLNETQFAGAKTVGEVERLVRESSADTGAARSDFVFPRWPQSWPVRSLRAFVYYLLTWPATHLLAHPRVIGQENLRGVKSPVLAISNHVIYLDVGFVLAALPPRLRHRLAVAMGGERLAQMRCPPREWFFLRRWQYRLNYFLVTALFNVFPLPKHSGFRESFRFAGDLVDRGWSVLVFPEGELTPDGTLQPFRGGIGLLALNLNIPVVPMRIDGAYEIREAGSIFNRPGRVRVTIGKPVQFAADADPQQITAMLEQSMRAL